MGNTIREKWIYPQNFVGSYSDDIKNGHHRYVKQMTFLSDGDEESNYVFFHRQNLMTENGNVPSKLAVEKIEGVVDGSVINLSFNNDTDEYIARLYDGKIDLKYDPGMVSTDSDETGGGNGDVVFSTENTSSGDTFTLIITVRTKD